MKIHVDFSLFTESDGSFGTVHGFIEFASPPQIGDTVSFQSGKAGVVLDPRSGFVGMVEVHGRIFTANPDERSGVSLLLADVTVPTPDAARIAANYLERAFGLFIDVYNDS
ncbi:hypothetical protein [Tahibacter soli]|uniref:Uncharacterized protein n=1 Tax=Tahibacter soli TaxID=2983605 RepID=A0A9X3YJV7_9GAMM|nr:hypothetical protein [Tahibacter soli]MDC8012565.1 hypothetical protein [Tahibacter soli]